MPAGMGYQHTGPKVPVIANCICSAALVRFYNLDHANRDRHDNAGSYGRSRDRIA